jgi:hypothetical protein
VLKELWINNRKKIFLSAIIWLFLVLIFDTKLVWSISFIGGVLFGLKYIIDLYLHYFYHKHYGISLNISLRDRIDNLCYLSPPIIIFIIATVFNGETLVSLIPNFKDQIITLIMGTWFAGVEALIFTNRFMNQVIETLLPENQR